MWAYVIRRTLYGIPILLGVTLIIFILFNLVVGDPVHMMLGKNPSAEQIAEVRAELGLDRPLYAQYFDVVKSAFTFDFGRSWSTKQKITEMIAEGAPVSLSFTIPAFLLSTFLSISISLLVAFYRGKKIDKFFVTFCVILMSVPSLSYILFGQKILAYDLDLFEISGYEYGFPYFIPYVMLPIVIWIILTLGPDVRFYRTIMLDEIYQDYVRTARAKGLSEFVILFKHVLKNAMIPIITYLVIQLPFLILGALLIESFFAIPGLGGITLNAINSSDFPVVKAMTVFTAVAYVVFSIITDIFYTFADPRVRLR